MSVPTGVCWFCKRAMPTDALIAGYDTFDEQRLACLACNERMSANWSPDAPRVAGLDDQGVCPEGHPCRLVRACGVDGCDYRGVPLGALP